LTLLSLTGALSVIVNATTLVSYIASVSFLSLAGMLSHALISRSRLREKSKRERELFQKYIEEIGHRAGSFWRMKEIDKRLTIDENGDAVDHIKIKAEAVGRELSFFRFHVSSGWEQPLRQRKKVCVYSSSPVDGALGGVEHEVTTSWLTASRIEILVHFHSDVPADHEFVVVLAISWPGKCKPLIKDGRMEAFKINFSGSIDLVDYVVVLPSELDVLCQPIGFTGDDNGNLSLNLDSVGRQRIIKLKATETRPNQVMGFLLQKKQGHHGIMAPLDDRQLPG